MPVADLGPDVDFVRSRQKDAVHSMIRQHLKPGQTAVDVGAAAGELTATMRGCVGPTGTVIAIEPRETQIDEADIIHRVAVGARSGVGGFWLAPSPTGSSLLRGTIVEAVPPVACEVTVKTLDQLVERADLVKLDVQGAEIDVLLGAPKLLASCPVWVLEIWPYGFQCAERSMEDLWTLLQDATLIPYDVDGYEITGARLVRWLMRIRRPTKHTNWVCVRG